MPPFLLDECTQTLETLALGGLHRTVNGQLIYTGWEDMVKYKSHCAGKGKMAPGLAKLKRGDAVEVDCIQRLWQEALTTSMTLSRPAVQATLLVMDRDRRLVPFRQVSPTQLEWEAGTGPVYVSYCPHLQMRVVDMGFKITEWEDTSAWWLNLEEV